MIDKKTEIRAAAELRAVGDDSPKLVGYAAVFNEPSELLIDKRSRIRFREIIKPGAFAESLESETEVKADIEHDRGTVIARRSKGTLKLVEDERGLLVEIDPPNSTIGNDLLESVRRGDVDQMSFAFTVKENGERKQRQEDGTYLRELTNLQLERVTITAEPAYPDTSIAVRSLVDDALENDNEPILIIEKLRRLH